MKKKKRKSNQEIERLKFLSKSKFAKKSERNFRNEIIKKIALQPRTYTY